MNTLPTLPGDPRPALPPWLLAVLGGALVVLAVASPWAAESSAEDARPGPTASAQRPAWTDEILDLYGSLPVQDGGRIKPFSTWAKYTLLEMNHKSSCQSKSGEKRSALEWALDTLYFPDVAKDYLIYRVENDEVITDLGLSFGDKKKSDRYTYNEILPGRARLVQQYQRLHDRMEKEDVKLQDLSPVEQGLVALGSSILRSENLFHYFDFGREIGQFGLHRAASPALRTFLGSADVTRYSDVVAKAPEIAKALRSPDGGGLAEERGGLERLLSIADSLAGPTQRPGTLPPPVGDERRWSTPWNALNDGFSGAAVPAAHVQAIRELEAMTAAAGQPAEFEKHLEAYREIVVGTARERGDYDKVPLEVSFYKLDPFYKSMLLYLLAFLLVAFSWFKPGTKWLTWAILGLLGGAFALHATGITMRCILRERPPVTTLYETIIFVSAVGVLACFVIERINRQNIALSIAPILGALGLFTAQGYEDLNRQDTMPQLVAVLDTNFWLATHVVCITIGYSAGLLAGALGHVYVLGRAFGLKAGNSGFYLTLGRMVYGTLCFALLFSVVGTILGGIWANDSWGRFWGWDPKENGALLICIWQVLTLHSRMAGYVRAHGLAMMTIFGCAVVVFSWWHVNLLGIGLHSYGFTQGIYNKLMIFYAVEGAVLLTGGLWWLQNRAARSAA